MFSESDTDYDSDDSDIGGLSSSCGETALYGKFLDYLKNEGAEPITTYEGALGAIYNPDLGKSFCKTEQKCDYINDDCQTMLKKEARNRNYERGGQDLEGYMDEYQSRKGKRIQKKKKKKKRNRSKGPNFVSRNKRTAFERRQKHGGRKRKSKRTKRMAKRSFRRTRRKRGGGGCEDDYDCDHLDNETHTGKCVKDNDGNGVCTAITNNQGGRRRKKRTRRRKKSKRRRRKRKKTKKKKRRRRRK